MSLFKIQLRNLSQYILCDVLLWCATGQSYPYLSRLFQLHLVLMTKTKSRMTWVSESLRSPSTDNIVRYNNRRSRCVYSVEYNVHIIRAFSTTHTHIAFPRQPTTCLYILLTCSFCQNETVRRLHGHREYRQILYASIATSALQTATYQFWAWYTWQRRADQHQEILINKDRQYQIMQCVFAHQILIYHMLL